MGEMLNPNELSSEVDGLFITIFIKGGKIQFPITTYLLRFM